MEEILLKFIASGGSVGTAVLAWYIYKIEPRIRSLELTQLQGQQVDLLKIVKELASGPPEIHERAQLMLENTNKKIEELTK